MPIRKRRTAKRRKIRRRNVPRTNYSLTSRTGPVPPAFPLSKSFKYIARYVADFVDLDSGIGGIPVSKVFSLNGLYDPDISGTGHQPLGFDQLMLMYDHYTVIGARVRVSFQNLDDTNSTMALIHVKDTNTTNSNIEEIIENGMTRYMLLGPEPSGQGNGVLALNISMKKFFGKTILTEHDYRGTVSSNPSEQCFLHVTGAPRSSSDLAALRATVELEYIAILHEPKQLGQS